MVDVPVHYLCAYLECISAYLSVHAAISTCGVTVCMVQSCTGTYLCEKLLQFVVRQDRDIDLGTKSLRYRSLRDLNRECSDRYRFRLKNGKRKK